MLTKMLLLLLTLTLTACYRGTIERIDTACSWVRPISTSAADRKAMSRPLKVQLVAHNNLWDSKCGDPEPVGTVKK